MERKHHKKTGSELLARVVGFDELPDGYVLQLPPETELIQKAGTFASRERLCCRFLRFELEVEPEQGPVWLRLTGPDGTKGYLKETLVPLLYT